VCLILDYYKKCKIAGLTAYLLFAKSLIPKYPQQNTQPKDRPKTVLLLLKKPINEIALQKRRKYKDPRL